MKVKLLVLSFAVILVIAPFLFVTTKRLGTLRAVSSLRLSLTKSDIPVQFSISQLNHDNAACSRNGGAQFLANATRVFVISLPRRRDRRARLEQLRSTLNVSWCYVAAADTEDESISRIMKKVRDRRRRLARNTSFPDDRDISLRYLEENILWPSNIDELSLSTTPLDLAGSDTWSIETPFHDEIRQNSLPLPFPMEPLTCSVYNARTPYPTLGMPEYKILTRSKIACWYSHLYAIRAIADGLPGEMGLVLEDDIDIESDASQRLRFVRQALPEKWDMIFLGHCWSNETTHPALPFPTGADNTSFQISPRMHPSFAPKCTHAYALSTSGARRLLLHLRHPPFAYSRAIDQAFAWLIKSGRITSFSVVPSVVIQRKEMGSDVSKNGPSRWLDRLESGVLN